MHTYLGVQFAALLPGPRSAPIRCDFNEQPRDNRSLWRPGNRIGYVAWLTVVMVTLAVIDLGQQRLPNGFLAVLLALALAWWRACRMWVPIRQLETELDWI